MILYNICRCTTDNDKLDKDIINHVSYRKRVKVEWRNLSVSAGSRLSRDGGHQAIGITKCIRVGLRKSLVGKICSAHEKLIMNS